VLTVLEGIIKSPLQARANACSESQPNSKMLIYLRGEALAAHGFSLGTQEGPLLTSVYGFHKNLHLCKRKIPNPHKATEGNSPNAVR